MSILCRYQFVITKLSLLWAYQIVITKLSLSNCHLSKLSPYQIVISNLSSPNCHYQIDITKNPPVIYQPIYLSIYLSIYLTNYLSIYLELISERTNETSIHSAPDRKISFPEDEEYIQPLGIGFLASQNSLDDLLGDYSFIHSFILSFLIYSTPWYRVPS